MKSWGGVSPPQLPYYVFWEPEDNGKVQEELEQMMDLRAKLPTETLNSFINIERKKKVKSIDPPNRLRIKVLGFGKTLALEPFVSLFKTAVKAIIRNRKEGLSPCRQ
jgi:hypothetical protein